MGFRHVCVVKTVTIIGGGLAGLALGLALRRHEVPVVIKEAGAYPRHRVCGEFISGLPGQTIEALGLADCLSDSVELKDVAWYDNRRKLRSDPLPVAARGLSRWTLDQSMAGKFIQAGGLLETGERANRKDSKPGWVDCGGRRPQPNSEWLGLKGHFKQFDQSADLEMHMSPNGYVGICRVEGSRYNLCGLFRKAGLKPGADRPLVLDYLKHCGFDALLERIDTGSHVAGSACSVAAMSYRPQQAQGDRICLGDAHGLIPPFTGNGMSMAFEHAALAMGPLERYAKSETSWEQSRREITEQSRMHFTGRLRVARGLHGLLTSETLFKAVAGAARSPLFPFQTFFRLTR